MSVMIISRFRQPLMPILKNMARNNQMQIEQNMKYVTRIMLLYVETTNTGKRSLLMSVLINDSRPSRIVQDRGSDDAPSERR